MALETIDGKMCDACDLRINDRCPIIESCPTDVIRWAEDRRPTIVYPEDCHVCYLCQIDCPYGAVKISTTIPFEIPLD
ncbi:MAG: ferredoxin family protein [Thermodesulfobacteriota bacterium]